MRLKLKDIDNVSQALSVRELWSLFDRTRFAISRLRELELVKYGLTLEQSSILQILNDHSGSATAKELEHVTMRQHHSISALINGMNKKGLVSKVKNPGEKRFLISLTEEGQSLSAQVTKTSLDMVFSKLSSEDQLLLADDLISLLSATRKLLGFSEPYSLVHHRKQIITEIIIRDLFLKSDKLWSLFDRTAFAVSRLRGLELARFGLTIEQSSVLQILTNLGTITAKELEDITMRRQHSISVLIKGMLEEGLVARVRKAQEKRSRISLTPKGHQLYQKVTVSSLEGVFSVLNDENRLRLTDYFLILLERARYLLGITYQPPFAQYLANGSQKDRVG